MTSDINGYLSSSNDAPVIVPSALVPISDNEADNNIRTGIPGTTGEFSDAGHNHPIVRQALPTVPDLIYSGTGTMSGQTTLDRWSTEETVGYEVRVIVDSIVGTSWEFITVPSLTGFQPPKISVGTYRQTSNSPQPDTNQSANDGAAPYGPIMACEAHHWSSTQRVYLAYYRREAAYRTYVTIRAEYIRI